MSVGGMGGASEALAYFIKAYDMATPVFRAFGAEVEATTRRVQASLTELNRSVEAQSRGVVGAAERENAALRTVAAEQAKVAGAAGRSAKSQAAAADESVAASRRQGIAARNLGDQSIRMAAETSASFGRAESSLTRMGKYIAGVGIAAAGGSLDLAAKFQANTLRMQTQAGATTHQLDRLREGLLKMAGQVGSTPEQLANGMYHVVSAMNAVIPPSQRVSQELQIMKIAAEGAQVGHSNLEETTYALASALNAMHMSGKDASKMMGELNAIVGSGDMTMQDLVDAFKSGLIPTARTFGLTMASVGAAMAVMGDMGMRGALAGTRLRMAIALLGAPSDQAAGILETLGLKADVAIARTHHMSALLAKAGVNITSLSDDLRKPNGLQVALSDLDKHLQSNGLSAEGAGAAISRAFGGGRMGSAIQLMAENTGRLSLKFDYINHQSGRFGEDWKKTSESFRVQVDRALAAVEAFGISFGTKLIPPATTALHALENMFSWLSKNKTALEILKDAVITFASVAIGSYLITKLRAAVDLMSKLGGGISTMGRWLVGSNASTGAAAASTGGGVVGAATKGIAPTVATGPSAGMASAVVGGGIWGVNATQIRVGTMFNPIAVRVVGGSGGLGGGGGGLSTATAGVVPSGPGPGSTVAEQAAAKETQVAATAAAGAAAKTATTEVLMSQAASNKGPAAGKIAGQAATAASIAATPAGTASVLEMKAEEQRIVDALIAGSTSAWHVAAGSPAEQGRIQFHEGLDPHQGYFNQGNVYGWNNPETARLSHEANHMPYDEAFPGAGYSGAAYPYRIVTPPKTRWYQDPEYIPAHVGGIDRIGGSPDMAHQAIMTGPRTGGIPANQLSLVTDWETERRIHKEYQIALEQGVVGQKQVNQSTDLFSQDSMLLDKEVTRTAEQLSLFGVQIQAAEDAFAKAAATSRIGAAEAALPAGATHMRINPVTGLAESMSGAPMESGRMVPVGRVNPNLGPIAFNPQNQAALEQSLMTEEQLAASMAPTAPGMMSRFGSTVKGAGSGLKAFGSNLGGGLMRGASMFGMGALGAQLIGQSVGGSTGSNISSIGTAVSAGAGLGAAVGSIVPVVGTGLGAGIGAAGAAAIELAVKLFHKDSSGEKMAHGLTAGFGGAAANDLKKQITHLGDDAQKQLQSTVTRSTGRTGEFKVPITLDPSQLTGDKLNRYNADMQKIGHTVAGQLEKGWNQYKFQSEGVMFEQFKAETSKLKPVAQEAALQSAAAFAKKLESEGRLQKGGAQQFIRDVEQQFPGLVNYMGLTAASSIQTFNKALDFSQSKKQTKDMVDSVSKDFSGVQLVVSQTSGDVITKSGAAIKALQGIADNGSGPAKAKAIADIKALRGSVTSDMAGMASVTISKMSDIRSAVASGSSGAARDAGKYWGQFVGVIHDAEAAGALTVKQGNAIIAREMAGALQALGLTSHEASALAKGGFTVSDVSSSLTSAAKAGIGPGANPLIIPAHATGGRVPGQNGPDSWTLFDPSGRPAGKVGGGELLIANKHTERDVSAATQAVYGMSLGQMVTGETRAHTAGFSTGGIPLSPGLSGIGSAKGSGYVYPLSGFSLGRTDMGVDASAAPGTPIGPIGRSRVGGIQSNWYKGQPYINWQLLDGPAAGRWVYVAEQITNLASPNSILGPNDAVARFASSGTGIEMGWSNPGPAANALASGHYKEGQVTSEGTSFRNFIGGLTHGLIQGLSGGGSSGLVTVPAKIWKAIKTPSVGGHGLIAAAAQGVLTRITQAANQAGQKAVDQWNQSNGAGGSGGAAGTALTTASVFNDSTTASGRSHIPGFAELSNPPGSLNFSALGHLPMGTNIRVTYPAFKGKTITIPKIDVGAGGAPVAPATYRGIDLTAEAANELPGFSGLGNVSWARAATGGKFVPGFFGGGWVPGDPYSDSTLIRAAGNEFVMTGHGQQLADSVAPGLLDYVAANQAPHFNTGGFLTNAGPNRGPTNPVYPGAGVGRGPGGKFVALPGHHSSSGGSHSGGSHSGGSHSGSHHTAAPHVQPSGLVKFYDATGDGLSKIPHDAGAVASYVDNLGGYGKAKAMFGSRMPVLSISVSPGNNYDNADIYDVESGGKGVRETVAWMKRRVASGHTPGAYAQAAGYMPQLQASLGASGLHRSQYKLWLAKWDNNPTVPGGFDAHQYQNTSNAFDSNVGKPGFFGAGAAAGPHKVTTQQQAGKGLVDSFYLGYQYGLDPLASGITGPGAALKAAIQGASLKSVTKTVSGDTSGSGSSGGLASNVQRVSNAMFAAAARIMGKPYGHTGGHGSWEASNYDCSGATGYVLHAGGLQPSFGWTGTDQNWGSPGPGKYITRGIRNANSSQGHEMLKFFGKYLESGGGGPLGQPRVHWDSGWDGNFPIQRHPPGYRQGGFINSMGYPANKLESLRRMRSGTVVRPPTITGGHPPHRPPPRPRPSFGAPPMPGLSPTLLESRAPYSSLTGLGGYVTGPGPVLPPDLIFSQVVPQNIWAVISMMPIQAVNIGVRETKAATHRILSELDHLRGGSTNAQVSAALTALQSTLAHVGSVSYNHLASLATTMAHQIDHMSMNAHHHTRMITEKVKRHGHLVKVRVARHTTTYSGHHTLTADEQHEQNRLKQALQLVEYEMGKRTGHLVKAATDEQAAIATANTRMGRLMTRKSITADSVVGAQMTQAFDNQQVTILKDSVAKLQKAYKMAAAQHNAKSMADIHDKLVSALDGLDQAITDQITQKVNVIKATAGQLQSFSDFLGGSSDLLNSIQNLGSGTSLAGLGLSASVMKTLGVSGAGTGIGMDYLNNLMSNQGGKLTADQMTQAQIGVANQNAALKLQENPLVAELQYYQGQLPNLQGQDKIDATNAMFSLAKTIIGLEGTISSNNDALSKLTQATNANTNATMTGTVGFSYNGQNYVAGGTSTSDDPANISLGM